MSKPAYSKLHFFTVFCMFIGYSTYYIGRKSFTNVMPFLLQDSNVYLEKKHLGTIASSFMIFYSVSKFFSGVLSDQASPRLVFTAGLFFSGIVNFCFGFSSNVWVFTTLWCLNGFFQGFGWPPCAKLISNWFAPFQAGTVWSIVTASGNVSSSLAPLCTTVLASVFGWQTTFFCVATMCIFVSGGIFTVLYDSPTAAGIQAETKSQINMKSRKPLSVSKYTLTLLKSPFIQVVGFSYLLISITKTAFEDWLQLFLIQSKDKTIFEASFAATFYQTGAILGNLCSGFASDWCVRKFGKTEHGSPRLIVVILSCFLMLFTVCCLHYYVDKETPVILVAVIVFGLGCGSYGPHAVFGLLAIENAPSGLSGTAHAIVAAMAGGGSVIAGLPFAYIFSNHGWGYAFFSLECCCVFGILLLFILGNIKSEINLKSKYE